MPGSSPGRARWSWWSGPVSEGRRIVDVVDWDEAWLRMFLLVEQAALRVEVATGRAEAREFAARHGLTPAAEVPAEVAPVAEPDDVDPWAPVARPMFTRPRRPAEVRPHRWCGMTGLGWATCERCAEIEEWWEYREWQDQSRQWDDPLIRRFVPSLAQWRHAKRTGVSWAVTAPGARRAIGSAPVGYEWALVS